MRNGAEYCSAVATVLDDLSPSAHLLVERDCYELVARHDDVRHRPSSAGNRKYLPGERMEEQRTEVEKWTSDPDRLHLVNLRKGVEVLRGERPYLDSGSCL